MPYILLPKENTAVNKQLILYKKWEIAVCVIGIIDQIQF